MKRNIITKPTYTQGQLDCGIFFRVDVLAKHTFRLRFGREADFKEPSLNRYGILRNAWDATGCEIREAENVLFVETSEAMLQVQLSDGQFELTKKDGTLLTSSCASPAVGEKYGFNVAMRLQEDEKFYGLGDLTRDRVQMRGMHAEMWVRNVASYIPVSWLMSTGGWGLFVNTTWHHVLDVGHQRPEVLRFGSKHGELDFYLFTGKDMPALLDAYTDLTGKPAVLPAWAYGLTFVCNEQESAKDMLENCFQFRQSGLPCDIIGLEPGWMEKRYDLSLEKNWHPERFALPSWADKGPDTFLSVAARMGFKISMWLCCDYDLLYEAERRVGELALPSSEEKPEETFHADDFERDKHLNKSGMRMDQVTKPEEAWFEHLKKFVDQGISVFKLDGAYQVCDHPDRRWGAELPGGGMNDEEMHNLYPLLYNQQMTVGFKEHTGGRRPLVYSAGGYSGIQQFSATWTGDTGGGPGPLVGLLNLGMVGHSNTTVDMHVFSAEGIHFGFLQPWSQLNSWAYWRHPWLLGDELGPIFQFYARFRSRLVPYIYSLAHVAAQTGMPILRAMSLMYPEDAKSDSLLAQYMLGDAFLVGTFEKNFHLPAGRWIDFWTGERHDGLKDWEYQPPAGRGGALFLREGAIVPLGKQMDYWGQKLWDEIELHVFPAESSQFSLVEDDGVTLDYLNGIVTQTIYDCTKNDQEVCLKIGCSEGKYPGVPETKKYIILLYLDQSPESVLVNGEVREDVEWDGTRKVLCVEWTQNQEALKLECKFK